MNNEIRSYESTLEIRAETDSRTIEGYPIVFNRASGDLGGFIEFVDPKALDNVDLSKVYLIYGHEINDVLARSDAGSLKLEVDKIGLKFSAELPNTTLANDVLENIRVGNIQGMSFGFTVSHDNWEWGTNGKPDVRTIDQIDQLFEITLTPVPAYPDTKVALSKRDLHEKEVSKSLQIRNALVLEILKYQANKGDKNG